MEWAKPVRYIAGIPNLWQVTDAIFRSAQPNATGFSILKSLGITSIINLRSVHSDQDLVAGMGLALFSIPCFAWHPETEDLNRALDIMTEFPFQPVLVHCQYGSDRTGAVCAGYRIIIQGWPNEEALDEMVEGGFGFHRVWLPVVKPWVLGLTRGGDG